MKRARPAAAHPGRRVGERRPIASEDTSASAELLLRRDALLHAVPRHPIEPVLEVRGREVMHRIHSLYRVPELIDIGDGGHCGGLHRNHGRDPLKLERALVGVSVDRPETVHSAKVMDAVH